LTAAVACWTSFAKPTTEEATTEEATAEAALAEAEIPESAAPASPAVVPNTGLLSDAVTQETVAAAAAPPPRWRRWPPWR
jgi:hypothetical protein